MKTVALLTLPLFLLAACGGGSPGEYEFVSRAKADPEGEPIRISYRLTAGERFEGALKMDQQMSMHVGDMDQQVSMRMAVDTMDYVVAEILPDGAARLSLEIGDITATANGEELPLDEMFGSEPVKGSLELLPDGTTRNFDVGGGMFDDPQLQEFKKLTQYSQFVRYPPEGIRVGEAIDIRSYIPEEMFKEMGSIMPAGMEMDMDLEGELVLIRTEEIAGEQAAVFGMNAVITLAMNVSQGGQTADMDMKMRITGELACSLETGMPIGTMTMKMAGEGSGVAGDQSMDFTMVQDATFTFNRVKPE